jgi:hypothetical protein
MKRDLLSVTQTLTSYKEQYAVNNELTEQEKETLMSLLRKALAPNMAMVISDTEESTNDAQAMANCSDKNMFDGGFGEELADVCSGVSMQIGFMLGEYMLKNNISTPTEETLNGFTAENNLPPLFFSKGILVAHLHSLFLEDPLTLLLNYKQILQSVPNAALQSIMASAAAYVKTEGKLGDYGK